MSVRRGARASVPLHSDESFVTVTTRYCRPVPNPTPRIEFIGLNYLPEPTGIAPYTSAMARGLVRRRNSVRVLTAHPHYPDWKIWNGYGQWTRDESTDGVAVRRMRHYVPSRPKGVARLLSEVSFGLRAVFSLWGRPDVIVAVSPGLFASALVALRRCLSLRRVPLVVWVQDLYTIGLAETAQGGGIAVRVSRTVEGWMLRTADHVVVIHDRFASRVSEDFAVPRDRIEVVRNWTHLPPADPVDTVASREKFGWEPHETIVLHAGNMGVKQGLDNVIEAARLADSRGDHVRFVLLGDGAERARLEEHAAGVQSLQFIRPLDDTGFVQALASADVLLVNELPGVSEMAVPSKLTSYFAAGRPVLAATDADGITAAEVLGAGAGVVVPAGDPQEVLDGALGLGRASDLALKYGEAGRRYRETVLSEEHALDSFTRLIERLVTSADPTV